MEQTRSSLLVRVRDPGDAEGWREFYALYEPFLVNMAKKLGLNENDARDLVADVFVKCVQQLPKFEYNRSKGSFRGWLKTVMRNLVNDFWRQRGKLRQDGPLDGSVEPAGSDQVWERWDLEYKQRVLERALVVIRQECSPPTWACFREHVLEGRKAADVGHELDLNANAVYQNAHRVLKHVREQCAAYDEDVVHAK